MKLYWLLFLHRGTRYNNNFMYRYLTTPVTYPMHITAGTDLGMNKRGRGPDEEFTSSI